MMVSIIIATFNGAQLILKAIESTLNQTYRSFKIIVVDDGSDDNTKQLLQPYIDAGKIKYIYQQNKGLSAARNIGVYAAEGTFLKFLDHDDFLYPQQLELQVKDLCQGKTDISFTDYERLYPDGFKEQIRVTGGYDLAGFIVRNIAPPHALMLKREDVIKAGGFDETLTAVEDYDLWLRLLFNGAKIGRVNYIGCCYKIRESSMSSSREKMFYQECKVFEKINQNLLIKYNMLSTDTLDKLLWKNISLVKKCLIRKGKPEEYLPNTLLLTMEVFLSKKRGIKRILAQTIGIKNYVRLQYLKECLAKRNYKETLINEENSWRGHEKNQYNHSNL